VRIEKQAISSKALTKPALARTPLEKPRGLFRRWLSMIGCIMAPSGTPDVTRDIANVRLLEKCWETSAALGAFIRPTPIPKRIPWTIRT
jgi:hypothetical protein